MKKIKLSYSLLLDICEYFDISTEQAEEILKNRVALCDKDLKDAKNDPTAFYAASKNYIFDLALWNSSIPKKSYILRTLGFLSENNLSSVLDFGSGIGVDSMLLHHFGVYVAMCDIDGETSKFAKWRCKKYNTPISFIKIEDLYKNSDNIKIEAIMCLDVLEHCDDLDKVFKLFKKILVDEGCVIFSTQFSDCGKGNKLHLIENKKYANKKYFEKFVGDHGFDFVESSCSKDKEIYWGILRKKK